MWKDLIEGAGQMRQKVNFQNCPLLIVYFAWNLGNMLWIILGFLVKTLPVKDISVGGFWFSIKKRKKREQKHVGPYGFVVVETEGNLGFGVIGIDLHRAWIQWYGMTCSMDQELIRFCVFQNSSLYWVFPYFPHLLQ